MIEEKYLARPLHLPGLVLVPGDMIMVVDSRGRVIKGVFLGYASSFIALGGEDCKPIRFINIRRLNEILVLKRGATCNEREEREENRGA